MSCIYLHLMDVGAAEPLARKMGGEREGRLLASVVRSVCRWAGGHEGQMEQNSLGNSVYLITVSLPPSLPPFPVMERKPSPRSAADNGYVQ